MTLVLHLSELYVCFHLFSGTFVCVVVHVKYAVNIGIAPGWGGGGGAVVAVPLCFTHRHFNPIGVAQVANMFNVRGQIAFAITAALLKREKGYNHVHGHYRARVEHVFACSWHWKVIGDVRMGSTHEGHANACIFLHFTQFQIV